LGRLYNQIDDRATVGVEANPRLDIIIALPLLVEQLYDYRVTTKLNRLSRTVHSCWQEFMAPYFEIPQGARPDQMMVDLEEIFHPDAGRP
jgi:hypothetical protein